MSTPAISFIIPVRNDAAGLRRCLASIDRAAEGFLVERVVVDNGSIDGSPEVAAAAGCRVLRLPGQRVGALRNAGAREAAAPLLAFVDADHEVSPGWVRTAIDVMHDERVTAAGAPYSPPTPGTWVQRVYNGLRDHRDGRRGVDWLGSGNLVVRASAFAAVGGFDTSLEACEDVDFCRRLRTRGGTIVSDSGLASVHHGDPATLRGLFRAEMWRGRNNIRVSLRERWSWRMLPSVLAPLAHLSAPPLALAAVLTGRPLAAALIVLAALVPTLARAARMHTRASYPVGRTLAVAAVYDAARALALIARAGHRRASGSAVAASQ